MEDYNKLLSELATREGEMVEWKENVADERKLIETIVAFTNDFLNLGGGYIVCGAKEVQNEYIHFAQNPYLLDAKGRAFINLAKKSKTMFNESRIRQIKNNSKIDFENYVLLATRILNDAHNHAENDIQKNYILKALDYIKMELLPLKYNKIK